jgi:cardiolipin synthase (CMP-forming)
MIKTAPPSGMTTANKITIFRILLIPVFIALGIYYGKSCELAAPNESFRWAAISVFIFASATDGLDGWIARRYNQISRLGSILDPIADKGLLLSALITLSLTAWPIRFPLWFPILVLTKDILCILAAFLIDKVAGKVIIRPHWTGKVCTVTQMVALAWVMLQWTWIDERWPVGIAGLFTFISGMYYLKDGMAQLSEVKE